MSSAHRDVFQIQRPGWRPFLEVIVAPTHKTMMNDICADSPGQTIPEAYGAFTARAFTCCTKASFCFGTMYLNREDLCYSTIAHESLHAALAYDRNVNCYEMTYEDPSDLNIYPENEERLAALVGSITSAVIEVLQQELKIRSIK